MLLHEKREEKKIFDVTVKSSANDAVEASKLLIEFAENNKQKKNKASAIGLMVEEAMMNINSFNPKKDVVIDVLCRITESELILSLRDDGCPLNPTIFDKDKQKFTSTHIITAMADKAEYSRTLGFNNTIIVISGETNSRGR